MEEVSLVWVEEEVDGNLQVKVQVEEDKVQVEEEEVQVEEEEVQMEEEEV